MEKLKFSEVRKFVEQSRDPEPKLIDAADSILGVLLVLGPTIAGLPPEVVTASLGLLGAKDQLVKLGKALFKKITKTPGDDPLQRERTMSIAFCLISYSAFFDAFSKVSPDVNKIVNLAHTDQFRIAPFSGESDVSESCARDIANDPSDLGIGLPHPAETLEQVISRMISVYSEMAKGILRLLESSEQWGGLSDKKRKEVLALCDRLPRAAAEQFRAQYFDLASQYGEFAVWSNLREHAATHQQVESLSKSAKVLFAELSKRKVDIDLGLRKLHADIQSIPKLVSEYQAQTVWKDLQKQYTSAIQQPIIKDPSSAQEARPALNYPARNDIYIPQSFKVLRYSQGTHLEEEETWRTVPTRKDLGDFILSYLKSPYSAASPLVILGHPGSGKSLLSQILAAQIMSDVFAPIRLELRSINADNEIEAQIEEQIRKDIARPVTFSSLLDSLDGRPAIVIFDGYDELLQATGQVFAGYLTKVQKFQEREALTLQRNPIRTIVTSRITLIDKALIPDGSTILRLLEFDDAQRSKWISVWNKTNSSYFDLTKIKPFALPTSPKLAPIAEQPLLLLMLALYDSTANQLHGATGLDQCVLYDSLLRRFIERERLKDDDFEQMTSLPERTAEIDKDMERLGAAAIGMFNRHALHIRATQLDRDIEFFSLNRKVPPGSGRQLSQAELILGSFFFVHQSTAQQRGEAGVEREADTAFEFLHNTFGEFLVAHFVVNLLIKQCRYLHKLNADPELSSTRVKLLTDPDGLPSAWYASLMYAALFARPVIVSMMTEWFRHAIKKAQLKTEEIFAGFDDIIRAEVRRITAGREFPSVMINKTTSFGTLPLLGSLANYSLNLITLRLAISDGCYTFSDAEFSSADRRPPSWDRLTHLWRSWLSPDALNALNAIVTSERRGEAVLLRRSDSPSLPAVGRRIETMMNVALAVGDESQIAFTGVLMHDPYQRHAVSLQRARSAAETEQLGIEDEILLRELWTAARSRVDDKTRLELFKRCEAMIESKRGTEFGRCVDLIRAFKGIGDPTRYRDLVMRFINILRLPSLQLENIANGEPLSALFELMLEVDGRVPLPLSEMFFPEHSGLESITTTLREMPPNVSFTLLRWYHRRAPEPAEDAVSVLVDKTKQAEYVSRLSPHLALSFMRFVLRPSLKRYETVVSQLLDYYLVPERLFNIPGDAAVGIMDIGQRPKFKSVSLRFSDLLAEELASPARPSWLRVGSFAFHYPYRDFLLNDRADLGSSLLKIVSKGGSRNAKDVLYQYSIDRWLRPGRVRLIGSVIRYARLMDGGKRLLDAIQENRPNPLRDIFRRTGRNTVFALVPRSEIQKLPIDLVAQFAWLAEKLGDSDSVRALSVIGQQITDSSNVEED